MWRVLIVAGLMVSTTAGAEARGLRITFRPRLLTVSRPMARPVDNGWSSPDRFLRNEKDTSRPLPAASILDNPRQAGTAPASRPVEKSLDQSAHWCDNGKVVGSGTGFCVLSVSAGAPS